MHAGDGLEEMDVLLEGDLAVLDWYWGCEVPMPVHATRAGLEC